MISQSFERISKKNPQKPLRQLRNLDIDEKYHLFFHPKCILRLKLSSHNLTLLYDLVIEPHKYQRKREYFYYPLNLQCRLFHQPQALHWQYFQQNRYIYDEQVSAQAFGRLVPKQGDTLNHVHVVPFERLPKSAG